jgi:hypothetical protein
MIIDLNNLAYTVAYDHDQFYSFIGVRALAMTHLAIHDILNTIDPQFERYHYQGQAANANPVAASAQSTMVILKKIYPARSDTIEKVCLKWITSVENGEAKTAGITLGDKVAALYLQLRDNDGHEKNGEYTPMTKPGDYQYTPGFDWVWKPDFSVARPFALDSLSQFRSPEPPSMQSEEYTRDFNEVKMYGGKNSTARSEDQTHYAHWWAEFGEHGWNRIGRITAIERKLPMNPTNRMFALINMGLYDLYLASFESKYHYDTWRPFTAIRNAESDDNPSTAGDNKWEPEMVTPPWPEYPSTHAAVGTLGAEIVTNVYGTPDVSFTMESVTAPSGSPGRTYTNLDKAADDCADSRVMNGYHFRFGTKEGKKQGRAIAKFILANYLEPLALQSEPVSE